MVFLPCGFWRNQGTSWGSELGRNRNWRLWAALSIGGQHKALGNQRPLPDGTGNAGNSPLLWNGCNIKAVVFQLYRIYRPQRPDTLLSGAGRGIPRPLSGAGGTAIWRSTSRPVEPYRLRCHWSGTGNQRKLPVYRQWYLFLPLKGGGGTWKKCGFTLPT